MAATWLRCASVEYLWWVIGVGELALALLEYIFEYLWWVRRLVPPRCEEELHSEELRLGGDGT